MSDMLKNGSKGEQVVKLQTNLQKLGYDVTVDGMFGPTTEKAVKALQKIFGYNTDGIVGPVTLRLIDQQIGYAWNAKAPDAEERAKQAQSHA